MSVALSTGGSTHIRFAAITGTGSVYYTNNAVIQEGLEKHPKYGKLFTLESATEEGGEREPVAGASGAVADGESRGNGIAAQNEEAEMKVKEFSTNEDAKDYFAEKFGASRTKLMTRKAIEEYGKQQGVEVVWK